MDQNLSNAVPRTDLVVSEGGEIAWAIRKNSPELKTELNEHSQQHSAVTSFGARSGSAISRTSGL